MHRSRSERARHPSVVLAAVLLAVIAAASTAVRSPAAAEGDDPTSLGPGGGCEVQGGVGPSPLNHTFPSMDIVLLMDSSGSMMVNDPENCRLAVAKAFIDEFSNSTRVSVLDFDQDCAWTRANVGGAEHHLDSPGHDGIPDYSDPKADLDTIDANGATNLLCPLQEMNQEFATYGNASRPWAAVLFTDGADTVGNPDSAILQEAQNASAAGITMYTIGLLDAAEALLMEIANITGGTYYYAGDCSGAIFAFASILTDLRGRGPEPPAFQDARLSGQDVFLTWNPPSDAIDGKTPLVAAFEVWHGATYDSTGFSYGRIATTSAGTTSFLHTDAGADASDHFYQLRALSADGHWTPAAEQAAKTVEFLGAGKHLLSVPLRLSDESVPSVLQTVSWNQARTYSDGQWLTFDPVKPWSPPGAVNLGQGFWVQTAADGWWAVAGIVPISAQVPLKQGWNLLGYGSLTPRPLAQVLAGLPYLTAEGFAPEPPYYLRALAPSDQMSRGSGVWVRVAVDAVITFTN